MGGAETTLSETSTKKERREEREGSFLMIDSQNYGGSK